MVVHALLATVAFRNSRADVPIPSSLDALSSGDLSRSQGYMRIIKYMYAFLVGVVLDTCTFVFLCFNCIQ